MSEAAAVYEAARGGRVERSGGVAFLGLLAAWALLQFALRRPETIAGDWQGWRQSDTQTIARHFASDGIAILHPRIDWGGDGAGYVETELQLYTALAAGIMRLGGVAEWPGQLLSLACVGAGFWVLFRLLQRRFGRSAAWLSCVILLTSRGVVYLSTSIQPDTLAFLAFVIGLAGFLDFLRHQRRGALVLAMAATAVAGLVKPTALELGIVQFCLVAFTHPRLLRRWELWLGWAVVLALVGLFMLHAYGLFAAHGNTFGVLAGESKFPRLRQLLSLRMLYQVAKNAALWGIGLPAAVAGVYLILRRRLDAVTLALLLGSGVMLIVGMRYTYAEWGTHYHILLVPLGAWLLARAWHVSELRAPWRYRVLATALPLLALGQYLFFVRQARGLPPEREVVVGRALAGLAVPGQLVVVRSAFAGYDLAWPTIQNYEDPRVFYVAGVRGWSLPVDLVGSLALRRRVERGARYYVEVGRPRRDPELYRWLAANARLVADQAEGRIWSFEAQAASVAPAPQAGFELHMEGPMPARCSPCPASI